MQQKQRLSFDNPRLAGTAHLLDRLNGSEPYVILETNAYAVGQTCKRARALLDQINAGGEPASTLVDMIEELHSLDQEAVRWRQTSQWSFASLAASDRPDLAQASAGITDTIQLHSDAWMAYEWNYHRTARIIFLEQLIRCSRAALEAPDLGDTDRESLASTLIECTSTIQWLADEVLATVPQTLGDIDHMGRVHDSSLHGPPRCRAVGGYLLLWPVRTIKAESSATNPQQKQRAQKVFERIREHTGMKAFLGNKSSI